MGKFGKIKRQHGRVQGLDQVLDQIISQCPYVTRIIPGRMGRKRGKTTACLKVKYSTDQGPAGSGSDSKSANGLKCIYTSAGSWQEVFLVCSDLDQAKQWLLSQPYTKE